MDKKEKFKLFINYSEGKEPIEVDGFFEYIDNTTFASFPAMKITSSSQDKNKKQAKAKTLFRLLRMIENRLKSFKKYENYDNLFFKNVNSDYLKKFINYAQTLSHRKTGEGKIPVYSEIITEDEKGYKYQLKEMGFVNSTEDIMHIKEHHYEKKDIEKIEMDEIDKFMTVDKKNKYKVSV